MRILVESADTPLSLHRAWDAAETFVLLPAKTSVSQGWVETALSRLPEEMRTNHFCLLTSGSTGAPKLTVGSRARAERLCSVLHEAQQSEPVRSTNVMLPLAYCYAFVNQWLWARVYGRSFSDANDTMLCLVGPQARLILDANSGRRFERVIRLHFAGGRFPQELLSQLRETFPNAKIFNNYGCAEAMPRLAIREATASDNAAVIGRAIKGVELSLSPSGELLFRSEYGAVAQISGDTLELLSGWTPTGDLALQADDGQWQLLGRANEVFKRYGEKVSIPQVLSTIDGAAYREKDQSGEDGYVLVITDAAQLPSILSTLRECYPRTHWPLRIEHLPDLPRLPNAKIDTETMSKHPLRSTLWRQRI